MPTFEAAAEFACSPTQLFDFLVQPVNIIRVSPPDLSAVLIEGPERVQLGSRITIETRTLGMRQRLTVVIAELESDQILTDQQVEGPFRSYRHERRLTTTAHGVSLNERISFDPPGGMLGLLVSASRIEQYLAEMHTHRAKEMRAILNPAVSR